MADIKWSAFPSTTAITDGDSVVGLHSGANERFLVSSTPSASGIAVWDANSNLSANSTINGYETTATAAGTTTLTVASKYQQYFTGSTTQTVVMPVTSTLTLGQEWLIVNNSSENITVNSSGGNAIQVMVVNTSLLITCILTSGTTATSWNTNYVSSSIAPTAQQVGFITTGGENYNNQGFPVSFVSAYILGVFYQNLISFVFTPVNLTGYTTIDLGNIQYTNSGMGIAGAITSFIANNLLQSANINMAGTLLTNVSFNALLVASAGLTINCPIGTLSFPALINSGGITFTSAINLTSFFAGNLQIILGNFTGTANALTTLTLTNLNILFGNYALASNALTSLSLPALTQIGSQQPVSNTANFSPAGTLLSTINMPSLVFVTGTFSPTLAALTTLTVTSLQTVTGAFGLTAAQLTTLSLPALTTLGAGFSPVCALATTVTLTLLANVTGTFVPSFAALTALSLPALVSISGLLTITAANLVTFSMGATLKSIGGNFTMTGMKLNQASVDGILVSLAALDGTNGTTAYSSKTVNLSGGTSATPSATGLAAKAVLVARGCTVTNN